RCRRLRRYERARQRRQHRTGPRACASRDEGAVDDGSRWYGLGRDASGGVRLRADRERSSVMTQDVWILGIHMTKFGKHPDRDVLDLASEAALGALRDGGVTMQDMGILA